MPDTNQVDVNETVLEPGMPALEIGHGERKLVYLPGLTFDVGIPYGRERTLAVTGWDALLDRYTIYRVARRLNSDAASFADMAEDVKTAIEELGSPVDLVGFSTGGLIAYRVAASRPELVRKLVMVASGTRASDLARRNAPKAIEQIQRGSWRNAFATILAFSAGSTMGELSVRTFAFLFGPRVFGAPEDPSQLLAELRAWQTEDATDLTVSVPTLLIANARDRIFPISDTRDLAARLPDVQLIEVPGKGHSFPPNAIAAYISPFLA